MHYIDLLLKTVRVRLTVMAELVKRTVVDPLAINNYKMSITNCCLQTAAPTRQAKSDLCNFLSTRQIDRQPRRFIYPKDGGRFDAPKMHVFTHLLRKCFTGKSKVRLRPPKSTIYWGSKWPLFTPKTAWIKIAQKRPLGSTEHKNGKDSNFRFG